MTGWLSRVKPKYLLASALLVLFIPFPTTMVPEWKMQFHDEAGDPLSRVVVQQSWKSYTYFLAEGYEQGCTDGNGVIVFPRRFLWSGIVARLISPPLAELGTLAHGSTGTSAHVQVFDRNYISDNYWWRDRMEYYTHDPEPLPINGSANRVDREDISTCDELR